MSKSSEHTNRLKMHAVEKVRPTTSRMRVPGGWIYQSTFWNDDNKAQISSTFVPYPMRRSVAGERYRDNELAVSWAEDGEAAVHNPSVFDDDDDEPLL